MCRPLFTLLACIMTVWIDASVHAQNVRTFTLGIGGRPWKEGGNSIDPEILVRDSAIGRVDTTNTPEEAIEFLQRPGWISPRFFDPSENIAARVLLDRGSITAPNSLLISSAVRRLQLKGTVNGDHNVAFERKPTLSNPEANARGILVILDFGIPVGVHRVRFYPRNTVVPTPNTPFQDDFMRGYEVLINDRQTNTAQNAPDELVARDEKNESAIVDLDVEPQYVRLVKVRSLSSMPFEIDEVEVYGTGYLSEARYVTDLIDLGDRATIGRVRWIEDVVGQPPFSSVSVRVRSGLDDTPVVYQRKGVGEFGDSFVVEIAGKEYYQLDRLNKGPLIEDEENWSPWKSAENGQLSTALGPRRYIQFRLDFSGRIFDTRQVGRLQFDYLQPPIADTLRAEVFPRLAEAEKAASFNYAVLLKSNGPVRGYDRLEVDTNIQVTTIRDMRINGEPIEFEVLENESDRFVLSFPLIDGDGDLLEFAFDLPIFRFGSTFSGRAYNSLWPTVPQILESGNAVSFGPDDVDELASLAVAIPQAQVGKLVGQISLSTDILTPNGDGINDQMEFFFNLLQLTLPTPVTLEIYDLAGRRVCTVFSEEHRIGPVIKNWDGKADDDRSLLPGSYVWVMRVHADAFEEVHAGRIAIAY